MWRQQRLSEFPRNLKMRLSIVSRRLHRWGAVIIGLPFLVVIGSGILLQIKKQVPWIQPAEQRTSVHAPEVSWSAVMASMQAHPEAGVGSWDDVERVDVRPAKGILKVITKSRWELQLALDDGRVLQSAYRRSDLIEQLHDGSFFGDPVKLWIFLPSGIIVFGLWLSGLYLFVLPILTRRKRARLAAAASAVLLVLSPLGLDGALEAQRAPRAAAAPYVPGATWERRSPSEVGVDSAKLAAAIAYAIEQEAKSPRDLEAAHYATFGREPFGQGIGPFKPRGPASGVILRGGYVIASWGDPDRVDMTFSVTKSFLSTTVGLAVDRGLIADVNELVWKSQPPTYALRMQADANVAERYGQSAFMDTWGTPHNRTITWTHLLQQNSDWEGTLWGKPEWADRPDADPTTWTTRARRAPGTVYEYNDVRVNVLALAATNIWRRPLPEVLDEFVMSPIGASRTWRWYGYDNAWITLDGRPVQVVTGGGHWGGGLIINAWDMARFGLLTQRRGVWGSQRILSDAWVTKALTPSPTNATYGYMNWFLNTDKKWMPNAPASLFGHVGNGRNVIFVAPEQDLVVVVRWLEDRAQNEFIGKVLGAVTP
jgi:CubicO group peptidase (beta-lactamase class C family)